MYRLKFYEKEREMFSIANVVHLSDRGTRIVISKLSRHYKLRKYPNIIVKFRNNGGDSGTCYYTERKIIFNHQPSLLVVAHEFAHLMNYEKGKKHHHTKQLMKSIERILDYCFKKECWTQEILRRLGKLNG